MLKRKLWLCLLLGLLLALASCGPRTLSPQAYQELVIEILQGRQLEEGLPASALALPGLIPSIKKLFDSLYCAEYSCVFPSEMDYAAMMAEAQLYEIAAYKVRICNNKRVRPPKELLSIHEQICELLDGVRADIDAIKITARIAAQVLQVFARSADDSSTLEKTSRSYSAKIMERKGAIINRLRQLREIAWLAPVFEGVEAQIPELQMKAE